MLVQIAQYTRTILIHCSFALEYSHVQYSFSSSSSSYTTVQIQVEKSESGLLVQIKMHCIFQKDSSPNEVFVCFDSFTSNRKKF